MQSIWSKNIHLPDRKKYREDKKADAVVIGGGLTGILTAYFLTASGLDTIVLEAGKVGSGMTKNTTAKITSQHGLKYEK